MPLALRAKYRDGGPTRPAKPQSRPGRLQSPTPNTPVTRPQDRYPTHPPNLLKSLRAKPTHPIDPSHHKDCMTSTSRHSATASRSSAPHHPAPPAAPPVTPAPDTPALPPNVPIADSSGPTPDTQPDLAGTQILVLSLYYWPERAGSAPPVQQMAEALARLGAEVTVLTARPAYPEMSVYPEYRSGARDRETQTHSRDPNTLS